MSFDAIFEQPDLTRSGPLTGPFATTYHATATRADGVWTVTVHDLPEGRAVQAQGRTWGEAEAHAHGCVVDLLEVDDVSTVIVHVLPADSEAAAAIEALTAARVARAVAEQAERDAVRAAARTLTSKGWSTRDAGTALRLSHQRISQIAPRTTA